MLAMLSMEFMKVELNSHHNFYASPSTTYPREFILWYHEEPYVDNEEVTA